MKDALLRAIGVALDGIEVGYCAFDARDQTLAWNATFLQLFPEHDGHVHVGEHYSANLRRFYSGRLGVDELPMIDRYIDEGVTRHRIQRRPYEFDHHDYRVRVSSIEIGRFGRVRVWRKVAALPQRLERPGATRRFLQEANVEQMLERLSDGVVVVDVADQVMWANQAFLGMYGLVSVDAAVGRSFGEIYEAAWADFKQDRETGSIHRADAMLGESQRFSGAPFELQLPDNRWVRVVEQRGDIDGRGYFVHADITDLKREQAALQEAEERYRLVAQYSSDIILAASGGLITYASPAVTEVLGWPMDAVVGEPLSRFCHPDDVLRTSDALKALPAQAQADYRARALHREGHHVWVEARARRLPGPTDPLGARLVINLRNITARKTIEDELALVHQELTVLATRDGLTGLANRRHLDEALEGEWRRAARNGEPLALLLLDIDDFKALNDAHGHQAGDEVLRRIGALMRSFGNRSGDVAGRYGGEELALLLPNTPLDRARSVAEAVRCAVAELDLSALGVPAVTVSVGVAVASQSGDADSAARLVGTADRALYNAKRSGKNRVAVDSLQS